MDSKIIQHLNESGKINDPILVSNIDAVLCRTRHLDEVPKPLKLVSVKKPEVCGIASEFKALYNQVYAPTEDNMGEIVLQGNAKQCDYTVDAIMKSLIMLGINKNEDRALACKDIFMQILRIPSAYIKSRGIAKDLFGEEKLVLFIVMRMAIDKPDYATFASQLVSKYHLSTRDELNKFVEDTYKTAKEDKNYTGKIRGVSRDKVAMDYLYKMDGGII